MAQVYARINGAWRPCGPYGLPEPPDTVDPDEPLDIPFSGGSLSAYLRDPTTFINPLNLSPGCRVPAGELEVLSPAQARTRAMNTGRLDRVLINSRLQMNEPFWGDVKGEDIVIYGDAAIGATDGSTSGTGYGIEAWWSSSSVLPAQGKRPHFNYITILGKAAQPGYVFNPSANPYTQRGVIGGPIHLSNVLIRGCGASALLHTRDVLVERFKFMDYTRGSGTSHVGGMQITHAGGTAVFRDGVISGYFGPQPGFNAEPGQHIGSACIQNGSTLQLQINRMLFENVVLSGGSYGIIGPSGWRGGVTPPSDGFVSDSGWAALRGCKSLRDHRESGVAAAGNLGEFDINNTNVYADNGVPW